MISHVLNNKCQCWGYSLHNTLFFSDDAMLQNANFCMESIIHVVTGTYGHKMENILLDHFGDINFTSAQKKKQPFEMKPIPSETRNRTSDRFTNLILTGGLTGATSYSSLSLLADRYQESGHYAPLKALREQSICYYFSSAGCI